MIRKEQLYEQILEQIDLTKETDDEELQELIRTVLDDCLLYTSPSPRD